MAARLKSPLLERLLGIRASGDFWDTSGTCSSCCMCITGHACVDPACACSSPQNLISAYASCYNSTSECKSLFSSPSVYASDVTSACSSYSATKKSTAVPSPSTTPPTSSSKPTTSSSLPPPKTQSSSSGPPSTTSIPPTTVSTTTSSIPKPTPTSTSFSSSSLPSTTTPAPISPTNPQSPSSTLFPPVSSTSSLLSASSSTREWSTSSTPTLSKVSTTSTTSQSSISISFAAPSYSSFPSTTDSILSISTHSAIPPYLGTGDLLRGYCATPYFTVVAGPTADLYLGIVGCVNGKEDCCPFSVSSTHAATATDSASFVTVTLGSSSTPVSSMLTDFGQDSAFPQAAVASQATLDHCPGDYKTVSNQCCPSNYLLFSSAVGGQTPCYSTIFPYLTPPPLPIPPPTGTGASHPTSAIVNVVYAMAYPVKSSSTGLPIAIQAGVGAGVSAFALIIFVSLAAFFWKRRSDKKHRESTGFAPSTAIETPVSRASELYQPPNNTSYPQGAFDRRRYTGTVSPIERNMSVSPPDAGYGYAGQGQNFEYSPQQNYTDPVPTRVPAPRPGLAIVPPHGVHVAHEADAYRAPMAYGMPPGELSGESLGRSELYDQRNPGPSVYEAPGRMR